MSKGPLHKQETNIWNLFLVGRPLLFVTVAICSGTLLRYVFFLKRSRRADLASNVGSLRGKQLLPGFCPLPKVKKPYPSQPGHDMQFYSHQQIGRALTPRPLPRAPSSQSSSSWWPLQPSRWPPPPSWSWRGRPSWCRKLRPAHSEKKCSVLFQDSTRDENNMVKKPNSNILKWFCIKCRHSTTVFLRLFVSFLVLWRNDDPLAITISSWCNQIQTKHYKKERCVQRAGM